MMDTICLIVFNIGLMVIDVLVALLFSEMIRRILLKDRSWVHFLIMVLGSVLLQAAVYSWLPGRLGYVVQYFEDLIVLRDGAVLSNLGAMLVAQALAIAIVLVKHIWAAIRKKERFSGKYSLLMLLFSVMMGFAGASLFENEAAIAFSDDPRQSWLLPALFFCGLLLLTAGIRADKNSKKRGGKTS